MNVVDIAILVTLAVFVLKGLLRGLVKEFFTLVGLVAGALIAVRLHPLLAGWLHETFGFGRQGCVIGAFLLLFLAVLALCTALGYLASKSISLLFLGGLNRVIGGCFGLAQGVAGLALLLFGLSLGTLPELMQKPLDDSQLAPPFVILGEDLFAEGRKALEEKL